MSRKKGHKISQKQSVKQTVIVKVGSESKRKTRRRRRPRKEAQGGEMQAPFPLSPVIYQTGYGTFPLIQGAPVANPFPYKQAETLAEAIKQPNFINPVPLATDDDSVPPIQKGQDLKNQLSEAESDPFMFGGQRHKNLRGPFKPQAPPLESALFTEDEQRVRYGEFLKKYGKKVSPASDSEAEVMPKTKPGKKGLTNEELRERYLERYGKPAPRRMRKADLSQAVFGMNKEEL